MRRPTPRRLTVLLVLATVTAGLAAAARLVPVTPLQPDAKLPDVKVDVNLGQRVYNLEEELRNGDEVVRFYSKEIGMLNDPELQTRVERMGHRIITAAALLGPKQVRRDKPGGKDAPTGMTFRFRLLDTDEINAFSAWGGNIYITRGMLNFCQSEDELAGIIGHECAHSTYHHLHEQVQRMQRLNTQTLLTLLAAAFMRVNVAHVAGMVQWVHLALMNGHSVEQEAQADYAGCYYTYRAGYNPVGLVTTMERLHRLQASRPQYKDLGAFQTHPWSDERAQSLISEIRSLGLPIDRRAVTNAITAGVRVLPGSDGGVRIEVLLGEAVVMQMAGTGDPNVISDRAADASLAINLALERGLRASDVQLVKDADRYVLRALVRLRNMPLLDIRPEDAKLAGMGLEQYARQVQQRFTARCRQEELTAGAL